MDIQRHIKILHLAQDLIRIPSTKADSNALNSTLDLIKTVLPNYSFQEFARKNQRGIMIPSVLFFNRDHRPNKFRVLLHGHLDIVPAQDKKQYTPSIIGSRLYGRGAYDMKSATASLIHVFNDLSKDLPYPIGLSLTTDEEVGGSNGAGYQVEEGVKADFVISGEPTNLAIGNQHKGTLTLALSSNTPGGHTAYDADDKNALFQVVKVQIKATEMYPGSDDTWRTTCSMTNTSTTNEANNVVPADATGRLSIRWIPQDDPKTIEERIASINSQVLVRKFTQFSLGEAHFTDPQHPDIMLLSDAINSITKTPGVLLALAHSSDVRHWTTGKTGGVDFGISGANLHADNEYADIDSFKQHADILEKFLRSIHS